MNTRHIKSANVYLLILVLLAGSPHTFAQRPPTSGPNTFPEEESNLSPLIVVGGGVVLGAATYLYLKSRGPKLPIGTGLENYLLDRNILPTADAIGLMHELNPSLLNKRVIRTNKKLNIPDFPTLPTDLTADAMVTTTALPLDLKAEVDGFVSNMSVFRGARADIVSNSLNAGVDEVYPILHEMEKHILSFDMGRGESNSVINQLINDLLSVLNQALDRIVGDKILDDSDLILIRNISEDLSELLYPEIPNETGLGEVGLPDHKGHFERDAMLLASFESLAGFNNDFDRTVGPNPTVVATDYMERQNNTNLLRGFAFAVYLYHEHGQLITKGPEVEGKYFIKYAVPALKDFSDAYHNLLSPATYASAYLPPAKLFVVVETISGEPVSLQNPVIDFKVAFKNPQQEKFNELIIVPLYISR